MTIYEVIYTKDTKTRLVKMTYRNFMNYTTNWIYNRSIDENRVNSIYENIKESNPIGWTLEAFLDKSITDKDKINIKIINGQHRGEAIRKFLAEYDSYMYCDREVLVWIYDIENEEENEDEIIELFRKVNSSFQLNEFELPSRKKIELCNQLLIHPILKEGIKTDAKTNTSHPPYIHIKQFKSIFDEIIRNNPEMTNIEIIDSMVKINNRISCICNENSFEKLFGKKQINDERLKAINKANHIKFYLNIKESIYSKNKWLNYIKNPELIII